MEFAANPGALSFGQVVHHVSFFVDPAPGDHSEMAVDVGDGFAERFAAIQDEQGPADGSRPRARRSVMRCRTTVAFSVEPSTTPRGTLVPEAVTPSAPIMV